MNEQRGSGARYGVSDEVWHAIEPEARAAAVRERRVLLRTALVTGLVVLLGVGVYWSGAFSARLSGGDNSASDGGSPGGRGHVAFDLHNDGFVTEHVTRWALPVAGVEVVGVSPEPLEVAARSQQRVDLQLQVTDCKRATAEARAWIQEHPADGPALQVWTSRPWGEARTTVSPPGAMADLVLMACGVDLSTE